MPNGWNDSSKRKELRAWTLARDGGVCWLCGKPGATTVDHVVPRSLGGPDTLANLRAAHGSCNSARGTRLPPSPLTTRQW